jgi:hypothetical protein
MKYKNQDIEWIVKQFLEAIDQIKLSGSRDDLANYFEHEQRLIDYINQKWPDPPSMP